VAVVAPTAAIGAADEPADCPDELESSANRKLGTPNVAAITRISCHRHAFIISPKKMDPIALPQRKTENPCDEAIASAQARSASTPASKPHFRPVRDANRANVAETMSG
jgi:hypothetical protein